MAFEVIQLWDKQPQLRFYPPTWDFIFNAAARDKYGLRYGVHLIPLIDRDRNLLGFQLDDNGTLHLGHRTTGQARFSSKRLADAVGMKAGVYQIRDYEDGVFGLTIPQS